MLKKEQKVALELIFQSNLKKIATWGGGTALSEIYLHHRQSDDIDIIIEDLPPLTELTILSNVIKKTFSANSKKSVTKMNRFQYFFTLPQNRELKLEFVYYPFPKLGKIKKKDKLQIESLIDISVAKTLSAYQRREIKDTYDLFILLRDKHFTLRTLIRGVEKKFGEHIDGGTLLARLKNNLKDFESLSPLIIGQKYSVQEMANCFQKEFNHYLKEKNL